jgi:hypothetical protein
MKLTTFHPQRPELMPSGRVLCSEWLVGPRTVTVVQEVHVIVGSAGVLRCQWEPAVPRRLSKREWRQYRAGRDLHHQRLANILGIAVTVADL